MEFKGTEIVFYHLQIIHSCSFVMSSFLFLISIIYENNDDDNDNSNDDAEDEEVKKFSRKVNGFDSIDVLLTSLETN